MISKATTPEQYLKEIPAERQAAFSRLRNVIRKNLPAGFSENVNYGMIGFCVPHSLYPAGYHCDPKQPLPFVCLASQKNFITVYHMGLYAMPDLMKWFQTEFPKHSKKKLDMGKSCLRFKQPEEIPYSLIGDLMKKVTVKGWIATYERMIKR